MGDLSNNFTHKERACHCGCGMEIDHPKVLERLEAIRGDVKFKMPIISWCRCRKHNKNEGGKANSSHIRGWGVDVRFKDDSARMKIIASAVHHGCKRIFTGNGPRRLHLDWDPTLPAPRFGIYKEIKK